MNLQGDTSPIAGPARGEYLTDETRLYRRLGWLEDEKLVVVEDCLSDDVFLVKPELLAGLRVLRPTAGDLHRRRRRAIGLARPPRRDAPLGAGALYGPPHRGE